jgi:hypothetical protein
LINNQVYKHKITGRKNVYSHLLHKGIIMLPCLTSNTTNYKRNADIVPEGKSRGVGKTIKAN